MIREEAMRKLRSLLRLAERGGTVAEAATAAAKAQEIMDRYELTRESVAGVEGQAEGFRRFDNEPEGWLDSGALPRWRGSLAVVLAEMHGCFCYLGRRSAGGRSVELVGRPSQVETVRYLYGWLAPEIDRLTDLHGRGMGVTWRNNFAIGAVSEIRKRLREQRAATVAAVRTESAGDSLALVRVDRALARIESDVRDAKRFTGMRFGSASSRSTYNPSAREAGASAARGINLGAARGSLGGSQRRLGGGS